MDAWRGRDRGRRGAVLALALLAHVAVVGTMWHSRVTRERVPADPRAVATVWLTSTPAPPPRPAAAVPPIPAPSRLRAIPHVEADPRTLRAPVLQPAPVMAAARAAEGPASAASQPLDLTLTRDQLRAVIAASKPTLAQQLARSPTPSALAQLAGDDAPYTEVPLPGGQTEAHVHGQCFRLVPTPRSQYDPFNHGGERLTAACAR